MPVKLHSILRGGGLKVTFPLMDSEPAGKQNQSYEQSDLIYLSR
jgi:hypothetical protein